MVRVEPATVAGLAALVEGDKMFAARFGIAVRVGAHLCFDDDGALVGFGDRVIR